MGDPNSTSVFTPARPIIKVDNQEESALSGRLVDTPGGRDHRGPLPV
jgi:hypothetical protein